MFSTLVVKDLSYTYYGLKSEVKALDNISFTINKGDFVTIVGPSGCGKSTLLSCLFGLIKPDTGSIKLDDEELIDQKSIGYMHQRDLLFDWRTNYQNINLAYEISDSKLKTEDKHSKILALLNSYDLSDFANLYPSSLSGGMKQRIALIRTLINEPEILLLDEPFSALDFQTRLEVSEDIYKTIKSQHKTAILITHDIEEAISMSDTIYVLSKRPARVIDKIDIKLSVDNRTPLTSRDAKEFNDYFHKIYKELCDGECS